MKERLTSEVSDAGTLRSFTTRVAHVLPVSDDGGSTAEIVRVLGGPAVGDIRSRCLRLADDSNTEVSIELCSPCLVIDSARQQVIGVSLNHIPCCLGNIALLHSQSGNSCICNCTRVTLELH